MDKQAPENSWGYQLVNRGIFVSLKHRLGEVKQHFTVTRYVHVGDTMSDNWLAKQAGFDFVCSSYVRRGDFFLLLTGEVSLGPGRRT